MVVNLGDMFDKSSLNSMELTALKEIKWNLDIPHYILVGNHDSNIASLEYSSSEILSNFSDRFYIISKPFYKATMGFVNLFFLPYITEDNRKSLSEYKKELLSNNNTYPSFSNICFSHNDIKGFQFGNFKSTEGFEIEDIENNFDMYLNGHLHNPGYITKKILNVGNLCGQNFNENNFKTSHSAWVLEYDDVKKSIKLTPYENPYALNFYKIEINKKHPSLSEYEFKDNAVVMIKCEKTYLDKLKEELDNNKKIVVSKIIVYSEDVVSDDNDIKLEKVDYIKTFNDFILNKLGSDDIIKDELNTICN